MWSRHALTLRFAAARARVSATPLRRWQSTQSIGQTLTEKIVEKYAVGVPAGRRVRSGDYVSIAPAHILTHDNTSAVIPKFESFFKDPKAGLGAAAVRNPKQPVFVLDHNVQDTSDANLKKYRAIEAFAKRHGVDFYPAGRGIGHQVMCEEGYAFPGTLAVASDSHSNMYGGVGCLGTPVVRTDAASIWATGKTWWQVPPIARVELTGRLAAGVTGKDVIITLCGLFNRDEVLNHAIEFVGSGVQCLTIEERLTIANMTTEWGALTGLFPIDGITVSWLMARANLFAARRAKTATAAASAEHPRVTVARVKQLHQLLSSNSSDLSADANASYATSLSLDLSTVAPHVSGPNTVKVMSSVRELQAKRIKIQKAYIVSCVNSRVDDLAQAASVIRGKKVAAGVELYIAAASSEVQSESERRGDWSALVDAGAHVLAPGCGPCIGLGRGLLADGEIGISATNRNFKGRMGSPNAHAYLASPAVVAASAVAGYICEPATANANANPALAIRFAHTPAATAAAGAATASGAAQQPAALAVGFPATIAGRALFIPANNLNTDGIYPGKYTYNESMTPAQQAGVVMENYDPQFTSIAQSGDVLIGGFNFGTGSSREQAATALKYKGIQLLIAGSYSETFKRNAINNGFLTVDSPALASYCAAKFKDSKQLTTITGGDVSVDFVRSTITFDGRPFAMGAIGTIAQEMVLCGGQEQWVQHQLKLQQQSTTK